MLDEPMGSLDRSLRERLPEELRAIFAQLGLTVIYVTHDQDEALSVADRVVLLDGGRIVADDSPEELWTRPPTAWAARFLGFRNVAPARLAAGELITPWGRLPATAIDPLDKPTSEGNVVVVLRPAGLQPAPDGLIKGVVEARRFRGDHVSLTIKVGDAPALGIEAREGGLPSVGATVRLAVRPGSVHVIADAAALPSAL
jgi:thiamine transport system ATP-binding protein